MDFGTLVAKNQLADLTPLLDAPSIDDPNKKVRDTLRPGVVEMGQFGGKETWIMYYAYTVYGVWYSKTNLQKVADAEYPKTWDEMLAVCEKAKKKASPDGRTPASTRTTSPSASTRSSPRSAARKCSGRSTTWSRTPGRTRPSRPPSTRTTSCTRRGTSSRARRAWTTSSRRRRGPRARPCSYRTARGWRTNPPSRSRRTRTSSSRSARVQPLVLRQDAVRHDLGLRR